MGKIADALESVGLSKAQRLTAECGVCGEVFVDSDRKPIEFVPTKNESQIKLLARSHKEKTGHDELDVNITKVPEVEDKIDVDVAVNK